MKKLKVVLLFIVLIKSTFNYAQEISGIVVDASSNTALQGVNIYSKNSVIGTITKNDGSFYLDAKSNKSIISDTIYFSHIGYKTKKYPIGKTNNLKGIKISLIQEKQVLEEVKLVQEYQRKKRIFAKKLPSFKNPVSSFASIIFDKKIYIQGGDRSILTDEFNSKLNNINFSNRSGGGPNRIFTNSNNSWWAYSDKLQVFDIDLEKWIILNPGFRKRAYHTTQVHNGMIYYFGGKTLSPNGKFEYLADDIEIYDIQNDTVIIDFVNPHQTSNLTSVKKENTIILFGGSKRLLKNGKKDCSKEVHFYDLPTGLWYKLSDMPEAFETSGILIDQKVFIIGGSCNHASDKIFQFDLRTGMWSKVGQLFEPMMKPSITSGDGLIYIYHKRHITIFNPISRELRKYATNLKVINPNIHFYLDNIFILGGRVVEDFSSIPRPNTYRLNIMDFNNTDPVETKKL